MANFWLVEININLFLQNLGEWLVTPMQMITLLGSERFFIFFMPVLIWCVDYALGLRVGLILICSGQINGIFKILFHTPRPFWFDTRVQPYSIETSFGTPSGHAMNTSSIFGRFGVGMNRRWVTWICVVLIALVGISRLYLGMHFLSDVLVGWLFGGLLLLAFIKFDQPVSRWFTTRRVSSQYLIVIFTTLLWITLCLLPVLAVAGWQIPQTWIDNAIRTDPALMPRPYETTGMITTAGIWLGVGLGAVWLSQRGGFDAHGTSPQQLYRFLLGVVVTGIIWLGLDMVFPDGDTLVAMTFRLLRYALVGIWITAGAPVTFIRLKWAKSLR